MTRAHLPSTLWGGFVSTSLFFPPSFLLLDPQPLLYTSPACVYTYTASKSWHMTYQSSNKHLTLNNFPQRIKINKFCWRLGGPTAWCEALHAAQLFPMSTTPAPISLGGILLPSPKPTLPQPAVCLLIFTGKRKAKHFPMALYTTNVNFSLNSASQ